jgi:hypothetical protein
MVDFLEDVISKVGLGDVNEVMPQLQVDFEPVRIQKRAFPHQIYRGLVQNLDYATNSLDSSLKRMGWKKEKIEPTKGGMYITYKFLDFEARISAIKDFCGNNYVSVHVTDVRNGIIAKTTSARLIERVKYDHNLEDLSMRINGVL